MYIYHYIPADWKIECAFGKGLWEMTSNFRTSKPCILTLLMCLFMVQQHKRTGLSILQNERNMKGHEGKMKGTLMEMKAKKQKLKGQ